MHPMVQSQAPPWNSDTPPRLKKGGIAWAVHHVFMVVIAPVKHLTLPFKFIDHKKLSIYLAWNPKHSKFMRSLPISRRRLIFHVHFVRCWCSCQGLHGIFCTLGTTAPRWLLGSSHGSNLRVQMGARVLLDHDGTIIFLQEKHCKKNSRQNWTLEKHIYIYIYSRPGIDGKVPNLENRSRL